MKVTLHAVSGRHPAAPAAAAAALQRVTLDIGAGEQLAVIGPSVRLPLPSMTFLTIASTSVA